MSARSRIRYLWLPALAADLFAVTCSYYAAIYIRFNTGWGQVFFERVRRVIEADVPGVSDLSFQAFYVINAPRILLILSATLCTFYALGGLYSGRRFIRRRPLAWSAVVSNFAALAIFYVYFYLNRNVFHPRSFFATLVLLNCVLVPVLRAGVDRAMRFCRQRWGVDACHVILLGSGPQADVLGGFLDAVQPHGMRVAERLAPRSGEEFETFLARVRASAASQDADMLVAAAPELSVPQIMRLLEMAGELGLAVKVLSSQLDVLTTHARMPADSIHGVPLAHFDRAAAVPLSTGKAVCSTAVAAATLVLLSPLLALIAAAIRLTSHGPALFIQERIGVNRRPFRMVKFRTMYHRADELQAAVEEFNEAGAGLFKMRNDPRITPVGRFLRRFSLDELPQLWNVVWREMTIVGPRPLPRRDFENYYEQWHYSRHSGMPGLTCLWQVSGRSDLDFHAMCILDVFYLWNQSWVLDLKIVVRTVWAVLFAKGAY